jgi:hypothetical protein
MSVETQKKSEEAMSDAGVSDVSGVQKGEKGEKKKVAPFIVLKLTCEFDMWTQVFVIGKTRLQVLNFARHDSKFKGWIREIMSPREFRDLEQVLHSMKVLGYIPIMLLSPNE